MDPLESRVRDYLQGPGYRPIKFAQLAKRIGARKPQLEPLNALLNRMVDEGAILFAESGRIESRKQAGGIIGTVRRTAMGDGYITPIASTVPKIVGDIVVFAEDMRDAQDKDEVLVRLTGQRRFGEQRIAVVEKVLKRATTTFVGTYDEDAHGGFVRVDGRQFSDPITLDDPEAGGVRPGDKIVVEMLRFPSARRSGEAVLKTRLGATSDIGVDTASIIHEFGLETDFPDSVLEEARQVAAAFDDMDLTNREDLTGTTIITIDPVDARDFDDAISLDRHDDGSWTLGVHIADVSHFVAVDSELDKEARSRGNSVYLPGRVLPMLPEILSNGLASLQAERVRFTMSAFLDIDKDGAVTATRFANSAIRVKHRFAYEQVTALIHGPKQRPDELPKDVWDTVWRMQKLARVLRTRRVQQGAINLELSEVKIDLDRDGRMTGAHLVQGDESHQMIEECMLAANIAVARKLAEARLLFPRRIHPEPTPARLQILQDFVKAIGCPVPHLRSQSDMQSLLKKVHGTPQEYAVNFALLRSLKQATYSTKEEGHYALATPDYCHFTSPIRRYPDLVIHRQLKQVIAQRPKREGFSTEYLDGVCDNCSQTERRAADAERALSQIKLLLFLRDKIGLRMEATITGVDRYGFFARGMEIPAEGLVPVATLPGPEAYEYDRSAQRLIGRKTGRTFQLGDRVVVEIAQVDPGRRSLDFKLIDDGTKKHGRKAPEPGPRTTHRDSGPPSDKQTGKHAGKRRRDEPVTPPSKAAKKRQRPR